MAKTNWKIKKVIKIINQWKTKLKAKSKNKIRKMEQKWKRLCTGEEGKSGTTTLNDH